MIAFERVWAFALLPLPLIAWLMLPPQPARAAVRVPAGVGAWLLALAGPRAHARHTIPRRLLARIAGWTALILALAGPYTEGARLLLPTGRDLLVAVDVSASMAERDVEAAASPVERIAFVRERVGSFIAGRSGDRIGLIAFASDAYLVAPLTFDAGAVAAMLDEVTIGLPGRKTDLGQAIGLAVRVLEPEPPAERVLVVLTDGEINAGGLSATDASALAAEHGIRIHLVGFAGTIDDAHARHMREIAERTGGRYLAATSPDLLSRVYAEIDRMAPTANDDRDAHLVRSWTWLPLTAALLLLVTLGWQDLREP